MQDIFRAIKSHIPIAQVFSTYGVAIDIHNKALCPFHKEKTPSLKIYPQTNSYYCFGCGTGGDAVKLVSHLLGLEPMAAAQKLNGDFSLGLNTDKPPDRAALQSLNNDKILLESFENWIHAAYITLCDYLHILQDFKEQYAPKKPEEPWRDFYIEACHNLDYIQWLIDTLMFAEPEAEVEFYNKYGEEVREIAARNRALQNTNTERTA